MINPVSPSFLEARPSIRSQYESFLSFEKGPNTDRLLTVDRELPPLPFQSAAMSYESVSYEAKPWLSAITDPFGRNVFWTRTRDSSPNQPILQIGVTT